MQIGFRDPGALADALILPIFADRALSPAAAAVDAAAGGRVSAALAASRATGKPGDLLEIPAPGVDGADGVQRLVLVGLGAPDTIKLSVLERAAAAAVRALLISGLESTVLRLEGVPVGGTQAARAGVAAAMAAYRFDAYRTKLPAEKKPTLKAFDIAGDARGEAEAAWAAQDAVAAGVALARDLVNEPPNVLHPESFARRCRELEAVGVEVEVLGEAEMTRLGMGALLGVGQGSRRESQLAVMRWTGADADAAPLALVGKGVTFDTGGISLKPGPGMEEMKGDMGGAAAVTGAMRAIAGRNAKANVVGVVGLVENMPDGNAQRPGDIVTTMSGQTIEIHNTDAEGRLVLADALWYAQDRFKPRAMVDLATLTGAMVIALAHEYAGLFANDEKLAAAITSAGSGVDEPVWRMPLGAAYDKMIDCPTADMKNIGGREGGSITAAQLLQRFTNGVAWAHLDIAPTAWRSKTDDPRLPTWGTGWGVRLLDQLAEAMFAD